METGGSEHEVWEGRWEAVRWVAGPSFHFLRWELRSIADGLPKKSVILIFILVWNYNSCLPSMRPSSPLWATISCEREAIMCTLWTPWTWKFSATTKVFSRNTNEHGKGTWQAVSSTRGGPMMHFEFWPRRNRATFSESLDVPCNNKEKTEHWQEKQNAERRCIFLLQLLSYLHCFSETSSWPNSLLAPLSAQCLAI